MEEGGLPEGGTGVCERESEYVCLCVCMCSSS